MKELDCGWQIIEGKNPVLLVAGHNLRHLRQGKIKVADMQTGRLVRTLCEKYGFWGIVSTRVIQDPNWYTNSPFREKVKELTNEKSIDLVIDVHGSRIGASNLIKLRGNSRFVDVYEKKLKNWKLYGFIDNEQITLAEELDRVLPVIEIEIREDGRLPTIDEKNYLEASQKMEEIIESVCKI